MFFLPFYLYRKKEKEQQNLLVYSTYKDLRTVCGDYAVVVNDSRSMSMIPPLLSCSCQELDICPDSLQLVPDRRSLSKESYRWGYFCTASQNVPSKLAIAKKFSVRKAKKLKISQLDKFKAYGLRLVSVIGRDCQSVTERKKQRTIAKRKKQMSCLAVHLLNRCWH